MKKPNLIIHIGPHKTGTTSLQNFLKANNTELLKQGFYYPSDSRSHHYLPKGFIKGNPKKKEFAAIANKANDLKAEKVIFSSEAFSRLMNRNEHMAAFTNLINESFAEVNVICFVRNQYERTESALTQIIKTKPFDTDISSYVGGVNLNYLNIANYWMKHFGENSFKPIFYTRTANKDVISSFCDVLSINQEGFERPVSKNIKPEIDKLRLIYFFNKHISSIERKEIKNPKKVISEFSYNLINVEPSWEGTNKYKIIPYEDAKKLEARLFDSNEKFRKLFFPEKDTLFEKIEPYENDKLGLEFFESSNFPKAIEFLNNYYSFIDNRNS